MEHLIDKSALVAEIERRENICKKVVLDLRTEENKDYYQGKAEAYKETLDLLDTLELKYNYLEKFKSLQHISGDLKSTLQDWGYAPNLYYFDGNWHVDWISCDGGDSIKDFTGDTVEEAINKACNWFHSTFCNN